MAGICPLTRVGQAVLDVVFPSRPLRARLTDHAPVHQRVVNDGEDVADGRDIKRDMVFLSLGQIRWEELILQG